MEFGNQYPNGFRSQHPKEFWNHLSDEAALRMPLPGIEWTGVLYDI
jgi:hypothetical protein